MHCGADGVEFISEALDVFEKVAVKGYWNKKE
jgi:hypothetical protein